MTELPFIDEHSRQIEAEPEVVWSTLLGVLGRSFAGLPDWLTSAWGLHPRTRSGNWEESVRGGDTLPGFAVAEAEALRRLVLRGGHRFSRYELCFELDNPAPGRTRLRARTRAAFPRVSGAVYRALVIGSGGHRIAVGRMLGRVAARSEAPRPV
jgi:hypothetical protein